MKIRLLIILAIAFFSDLARGADLTFTVKLNNNDIPVQFCNESVLLAKDLTIEGAFAVSGMKISIAEGFMAGEDELVYSGKLASDWKAQGTLELSGSTVAQDYADAIRTIRYKNNKAVPTLGIRKITISLKDMDYLPQTKHFYRYVSRPGIYWLWSYHCLSRRPFEFV